MFTLRGLALQAGVGIALGLSAALAGKAVAATASSGEDGGSKAASPYERTIDSNGSFSNSIAIAVPAFHGLEPPLALSYDSSRGNGFVGVGWKVDGLSVIERARSHGGAPLFDDATDVFTLDGEELVACTALPNAATVPSCAAGGTHATRMESYLRIKRITGTPDVWEVTNRDGVKLTYKAVSTWTTYGTDADSVKRATRFRWLLASVIDTHSGNNSTAGNTVAVQYSYVCDGVPDCYIDSIAYNGNTIRFYKETRTGTDPIWYATGAGLGKINYRYKTIDVQVGGQRARAYKLSYLPGTSSGRSRLTSVQQFGRDATLDGTNTVTGGTALPPVTLSYSDTTNVISSTQWATQQGSYSGSWIGGDFNGDGRGDFLARTQSVTCEFTVRLSTGSGFTLQQWPVTPASGVSCSYQGAFTTDDFNGDGKTDVLVSTGGATTFTSYVHLSTGNGFTTSRWSAETINHQQAFSTEAGDFNGDGMADVYIMSLAAVTPPPNPHGEPTYPNCAGRIALSTGAGFQFSGAPVPACKFVCGSNQNIVNYLVPQLRSGDFNGDGRQDALYTVTSGTYSRECDFTPGGKSLSVYFGNANGSFTAAGSWTGGFIGANVPGVAADINGDGRTDMVRIDGSGNGTAFLSTGKSFLAQPTVTRPTGACSSTCSVRVGDFNGDGSADVVTILSGPTTANYTAQFSMFTWRNGALVAQNWGTGLASSLHSMHALEYDGDGKSDVLTTWNDGGSWSAKLNYVSGPIPDLLTGITGSLGGTTAVTYGPSTQWNNTNLPFVTQTATSVTTNDGRGTVSTTNYSYAGGLWNAPERRFLGFASATAALPKNADDAQPPTIATTFLQSVCAYPKPLTAQEKDGAGTTLRKTEDEYSLCNPATVPFTALNTATTTTIYDGAGASKSTKVTRAFNAHGNVIQLTRLGDVAASNDELTTITDYFPNTTAYIVNRPARAVDYKGIDASGVKLAETRTCYDGATPDPATGCPAPPPSKGDPTTVEQWLDGSPARYLASRATYDASGNVLSQSDPLNNTTSFIYDPTYKLFVTETRDALYSADNRHKTTATWDFVCGLPSKTTDMNGLDTTYRYDALCRPRKVATPSGAFTCTNYLNLGNPGTQYIETQTVAPAPEAAVACDETSFTGGANLWSRVYMDGLGRTYRTASEGPGGTQTAIETLTTYNARGAVASATAPFYVNGSTPETNYTTTWKYDALDRKIEKKHPDNNKLTQSFGLSTAAGGFETSTILDELNRPITAHTDAYGRTVQVDERLGATTVVTRYQYDLLGRLTDLTDHYNNQWTYTYDSLSRRSRAVDPDLGTWNYQYDDAGRLVLQTDAFATPQRTTLAYDALGRVLTKKAREGTAQQETTTFAYDQARAGFFNVGRQTTASNAAAAIDYNFDNEGRQVGQTYTLPGVTPGTYAFAIAYDPAGRVLRQTYPDGDSVGTVATPIAYDAAGRLKTVPGLIASTVYDARGNQTSVARGNAVTTNFTYSPERGWLLTQVTGGTAGTLQDLAYTRDGLGRIGSVASPHAGESWSYGYDDLDRLTNADNTSDNTLDQTFSYDLVGNMLTNSKVGAYAYPPQGSGSVRPHATTGISGGPLGSQSFAYDANGNMTGQGADTRSYDGENRLVGAADGASSTTFVYGPDGARLKKTAGGATTLYFGDDLEVIPGASPQYTKYLPGDAKRVGLGDANTTWLHRDHLQSVRVVTNSSGAVVNRANYRPYGEQLQSIELQPESKGFIGQRHDDETGLTYLHARYYDPVLGRFVQADPSDPTSAGVGINRYSYAGNNPVAYLDPSGLKYFGPKGPQCNGCEPIDAATLTRLGGGLRVVGGAIGVVGGVTFGAVTSETGVGGIAGAAVAAFSAEQIKIGLDELSSGQPGKSTPQKIAEAVGVPPEVAAYTDAVIGVGGGLAIAGRTMATTTAVRSIVVTKEGVAIYEVDTYGSLQRRSVPYDGLALDHQPSFASLVARRSKELGRPLTPGEITELRKSGTAVAVPEDWHRTGSRTYGGRNTPAQIETDANDPLGAATKDSDAMVGGAGSSNLGGAQNAAREVRDRARGTSK